METIKNIINKPAAWMYFVLVVALLIILTNNSGTINDLEAELDNANAEISASVTLTESLSNEITIRNDAISGLEGELQTVNDRLNQVDSERGNLETALVDLQSQLDSEIANPVCPTCLECPTCQECPVVTE